MGLFGIHCGSGDVQVGPAVADRIEKMTLQDSKGDTELIAKMMVTSKQQPQQPPFSFNPHTHFSPVLLHCLAFPAGKLTRSPPRRRRRRASPPFLLCTCLDRTKAIKMDGNDIKYGNFGIRLDDFSHFFQLCTASPALCSVLQQVCACADRCVCTPIGCPLTLNI